MFFHIRPDILPPVCIYVIIYKKENFFTLLIYEYNFTCVTVDQKLVVVADAFVIADVDDDWYLSVLRQNYTVRRARAVLDNDTFEMLAAEFKQV